MANKVHSPGKLSCQLFPDRYVGSSLVWRVLGLEEVGCHDTGSVGDGDHTTRTECCTGRTDDRSRSIGDEWNDRGVGTSNHKDSNVSTADSRNGGE